MLRFFLGDWRGFNVSRLSASTSTASTRSASIVLNEIPGLMGVFRKTLCPSFSTLPSKLNRVDLEETMARPESDMMESPLSSSSKVPKVLLLLVLRTTGPKTSSGVEIGAVGANWDSAGVPTSDWVLAPLVDWVLSAVKAGKERCDFPRPPRMFPVGSSSSDSPCSTSWLSISMTWDLSISESSFCTCDVGMGGGEACLCAG